MTLDFGLNFKSSSERLKDERTARRELVARELHFGVAYLDDAFGGIMPNDLVLLGARSNVGKTAMATIIAQQNARCGKRVTYFALEAEEREIERRMKYATLAEKVFAQATWQQRERMSFRDWWRGLLDDFIEPYEIEADADVARLFGTMETYYRGLDFNIDHLERMFRAVQDRSDLIILDHLHYVDIDGDQSENQAYKAIVKKIRDISLTIGIPVLVIAHLRKKTIGSKSLAPDLDDFHGSSDITKIATKCVLLAAAHDQPPPKPWLWKTYVTIPKDRMDGSNRNFAALMAFNARTGMYEADYELGRFSPGNEKFAALAAYDMPRWATRNRPAVGGAA